MGPRSCSPTGMKTHLCPGEPRTAVCTGAREGAARPCQEKQEAPLARAVRAAEAVPWRGIPGLGWETL